MKKPERVDVGQWWTEDDDGSPVRITAIEEPSPCNNAGEWARYADGAVPCGSLLYSGTYLGSGPNPEPSEWMIETLAEHAWSLYQADTMDPREWTDATEEERARRIPYARMIVHGVAGRTRFEHYAIRSLYRILRNLGKW